MKIELGDLHPDEREVVEQALGSYRARKLAEAIGQETVTIYKATQNSDLTEGKGAQLTRGLFFEEKEAENACSYLSGVMGGNSLPYGGRPVDSETVYMTADQWLLSGGFGHGMLSQAGAHRLSELRRNLAHGTLEP